MIFLYKYLVLFKQVGFRFRQEIKYRKKVKESIDSIKSHIASVCLEEKREGYVIVDVPDNPSELVEQLFYGALLKKKYGLKVLPYYPVSGYYYRLPAVFLRILKKISFGVALGKSLNILELKGLDFDCKPLSKENYFSYWNAINSNRQLVDFTYAGVDVGVSVYDTYLRLKSKPSVDLNDKYLETLFYQAMTLVDIWDKFLESEQVHSIILGHAVYNNWKLLAQLGCMHGIPVYVSYNSIKEPLHRVCENRGLQTVDHSNYANSFKCLPDAGVKILEAKQLLEGRFKGNVDPSIAYMEKSAYATSINKEFVEKQSIIIFLHSFFDSPHIYSSMVFEDFWAWINETLTFLSELDEYTVYLKPHPNRMSGEDYFIKQLKEKYSFVNILSDEVNTKDVIDSSPKLVVTVYGTVISEMAYHGIKTLACGDNPASSYSFFMQASSRKEYFHYLKNFDEFVLPVDYKDQVLSFFYIHNLKLRFDFERFPFQRVKRVNGAFVDGFRYDETKMNQSFLFEINKIL